MPDDKTMIEPINAPFESVAKAMVTPKAGPPALVAKSEFQIPLPLVQYELEHEVIYQRVKDGYVNATAMCKAAGRAWADYNRLAGTQAFFGGFEFRYGNSHIGGSPVDQRRGH